VDVLSRDEFLGKMGAAWRRGIRRIKTLSSLPESTPELRWEMKK